MDQFRVLGSLEVRTAVGDMVPLPSRRQRAILARLLLRPGTIVSADALAASAWGDGGQPRDVRTALQIQISRLRLALASTKSRIVTSPPGYRLELESGQVDAQIFEQSVAAARVAAAASPRDALSLYDAALAPWRGEAYGEFAEAFARPEAVRLDLLRDAALEERAELLLSLGDFSAAAASAEAFIAANPLRERPYAISMQAMARSGRASEALALYQRLRRQLVDQMGTEPSREVQEAYLEILRQDQPGLHVVPRSQKSFKAPPAVVNTFIGREVELQAVSRALAKARLVTLTGVGGVGKTRMVLEWAARHPGPENQAWVELTSVRDPAQVASAFLDAVGVSDPLGTSPTEALITILQSRRLLLIVDNCEHVIEEAAKFVTQVLRACPQVRVIATSRERLAVEGEMVITVSPLSAPDRKSIREDELHDYPSVRLFLERLASAGLPINPADPEVRHLAATICRRIDGLPLAVELTAAQAAALGLRAVAAATDMLELAAGRRSERASHRSLRATLAWSYDRLDPLEKLLLQRLTVFPSRFSLDWATSVCADSALPAAEIPLVLAALIDKSMVVRRFPPSADARRHSLLGIVRTYAEAQFEAVDETRRWRQAHARFVVEWVEQATAAFGKSDDSVMAELHEASQDVRAAHMWLHENDADLALRLVACLCWYAELRADPDLYRWAEADSSLPEASGHPLRPAALATAATGAAARGDVALALCLTDEGLAAADPAHHSTPFILYRHASNHLMRGDARSAVRSALMGWRVARQAGASLSEVVTAGCVAAGFAYMGDQRRSERWLGRCRAGARSLPGPMVQAAVELFAGEANIMFNPDRALGHLKHCYGLASSIGAHSLAGAALTGIVTVNGRMPNKTDEVASYLDVLRHWQELGDQVRLWITIRNLVPVLSRHGKHHTAIALHEAVASSPVGLRVQGPELQSLPTAVATSEMILGPEAAQIRTVWNGSSVVAATELAVATIAEVVNHTTSEPSNSSPDAP
ncbi:BTAD domain-containing putative transcriptional regulator [Micromonospora chersina]|uniref:BTAD domain-containing putative transcriptional regulator n=1 Tax=Micromonospora chersina TaxID=47854 RepID=UPI0037153F63